MNLYLIGYRGCGKTTIAKRLAKRLNWTCLDTDALIVNQDGRSIQQIFEQDGEARFRQLESEVIAGIFGAEKQVVSLGGGSLLDPNSARLINAHGMCIWLRAKPETIYQRLNPNEFEGSDQQRPPLTDLDRFQEIVYVLAQRRPVYEACADYSIDTDPLTIEQVVDDLALWAKTVDK